MVDVEIGFSADVKVCVEAITIGQELEGGDHSAIGGVLKGNDALDGSARLNGFEYIWREG